jgi:hypothetical protein
VREKRGGLGDFKEELTIGRGGRNQRGEYRRRKLRGGRLSPSGDGAQVTFRRRGGVAEVWLGVANFTAPLVGSGERPRRRIEAAAGSVLSGGGGTQGGGSGAAR